MRRAYLTNQNVPTVILEVVLAQLTLIYKSYASFFALAIDVASRSNTTYYPSLRFNIL